MQSCIRPFRCGTLTAGPDGIRKIDAQSEDRACCSDKASGLADLGWSPVLPSNRRYPRKLAPASPIWSSRHRLVDTLVAEQRPGDAGGLIGHGDQHDVGRPARQELFGPAGFSARLGAAPTQHGSRAMHEQAPDVAVPALRYAPQPVLAAARMLPGHQTEPGRKLPADAELRTIADRRDQRRRGDDTDAGNRRKTAALLVGSVPSKSVASSCLIRA